MAEWIELTASDGHRLAAWRARPEGVPKGGLVVCQEVFGVNQHIRRVCEGFAAEGYDVVAPALFDRQERNVELGYSGDDLATGRKLRMAIPWDDTVRDVAAGRAVVQMAGKVGVIGYCWGGSVAWLAACRGEADAAVCYYGGQIIQFVDEKPECPTLLHFGAHDPIISAEDQAAIQAAHPDLPIHVYDTGHGFNCDSRGEYDPEAAALARTRTLEFLATHLGA